MNTYSIFGMINIYSPSTNTYSGLVVPITNTPDMNASITHFLRKNLFPSKLLTY